MFSRSMKRTRAPAYAILTITALIVAMTASPARAQTGPVLSVQTNQVWQQNQATGANWTPGAPVTLTLDDTDPGTPSPLGSWSTTTDLTGAFMIDFEDFMPQPGQIFTADDGAGTKTLVMAPIHIDSAVVGADTVSGTATPSNAVSTWIHVDEGSAVVRNVDADSTGHWQADFTGGVDIQPGTFIQAAEFDADGDQTITQYRVPSPMIQAFSQPGWGTFIGGGDWLPDVNGSIAIDGDEHALSFDQWGNFNYSPDGFAFFAGQTVVVTDHVSTKSLVVSLITIDTIDFDADTISGTTDVIDPPAELTVNVGAGGGDSWRNVTAQADGTWIADFSTAQGDQGPFDVQRDMSINVSRTDGDGDQTTIGRFVHNPGFAVHPSADPQSTVIEGQNWAPNAPLSITIGGADPFEITSDDQGNFWHQPGDLAFEVGQTVTVTDGSTTKDTIVASITVDDVDLTADTIAGTTDATDPAAQLDVNVDFEGQGNYRHVTANAQSAWLADFSVPQGENGTFDIQPGTYVDVRRYDADGDATVHQEGVPNPRFRVVTRQDGSMALDGWEWRSGVNGSFTIESGDPIEIPIDEWGNLWYESDGLHVDVGQSVSFTDGVATKDLVFAPITIGTVDLNADTVTGTAEPGALVNVDANSEDWGSTRHVTAGSDGTWTADFSLAGDEDNAAFDIRPDTNIQASVSDGDGDQSGAQYSVPNPRFRVMTSGDGSMYVDGWEWRAGVNGSITIAGGDPVEVSFDEWGNLWYQPDNFNVELGQTVSVTDGVTTKTLEFELVTIDSVNVETDTVTGTATPGAVVWVDAWSNEQGSAREVTADGAGDWTADFSTGDWGTVDIVAGSGTQAAVSDSDGDQSGADHNVAYPRFSVQSSSDGWSMVEGWEFAANATGSISVGGPGIDFSSEITFDDAGNFTFESDQLAPEPGQTYTVTDQVTTKTLILSSLAIDGVDLAADTVSGTTDPDTGDVYVVAAWASDRWVQVDGSGHWLADFSQPPEQAYQIKKGDDIRAAQYDEDGDETVRMHHVPNPRIIVALSEQQIAGVDWSKSSNVTLTLDKPSTPTSPDATWVLDPTEGFGSYSEANGDVGVSLVGTDIHVRPHDVVTMTQGSVTKELTVPALTVDAFEITTPVFSGTSDPGSNVDVHLWEEYGEGPWYHLNADQDGNWSIDLSSVYFPGPPTARQIDGDDDSTVVTTQYLSGVAQPQADLVWGNAIVDSAVSLTVERGGANVFEDSQLPQARIMDGRWFVDPSTWETSSWNAPLMFRFDLGAFDLQAGDNVTVGNGGISATFPVRLMTVDVLDVEQQLISGQTEPGLGVVAHWSTSGYWGSSAEGDADGNYIINVADGLEVLKVGDSGQLIHNEMGVNGATLIWWEVSPSGNTPPEVGPITISNSAPSGSTVETSATFTDPDLGQAHTASWSWGDGSTSTGAIDGTAVTGSHVYTVPGDYTVSLTVSDGTDEDTATHPYAVTNTAPQVGAIAPIPVTKLGVATAAAGTFTDPDAGQTFTATWHWGDGTESAGSVTGSAVTGSHTYAAAGIYTVGLVVSDGTDQDQAEYEYAIVYDPASSVTGSGSFTSPSGAYPAAPDLTGKATFDLAGKFAKKGALNGGVTFKLQVAKLAFTSTNSDWLVVSGPNAWMTGTGKLNNKAGYGFLVSLVDGNLPGGDGIDRIRIQIWSQSDGAIVYDTQIGAALAANATTPVVNGSIVISQ